MNRCKARFNKIITCDGEYIESEGLCLRHAILFDIWIAEYDGWKMYGYKRRPKYGLFLKKLKNLKIDRLTQFFVGWKHYKLDFMKQPHMRTISLTSGLRMTMTNWWIR